MQVYICKCGRKFKKSGNSDTTGYRLQNYGPGHECFGCPYVVEQMEWYPKPVVKGYECRGSKYIQYGSTARLSIKDKCVGKIYSLDFEFLQRVKDYAESLDGITPDRAAFSSRPTDYGSDGRLIFSVYPLQNKTGIHAKQLLQEAFFNADGTRKDVSPEHEKQIIIEQIQIIKEAKRMGKINVGNITAGLDKVKSIAESLSNVSHFELVPLECIEPAEHNPFAEHDTDQSRYDVAMSIQANGLLEPLVVNKKSQDRYTLIAGEHRYTSIKQYLSEQFKKVPCMVFEGQSDDEAQLKLYEANRQREYTPEQKFRRYQELEALLSKMKESGTYHGPIQKGLAGLLGVSTRQIRKYQTITQKLSPEQQQAVIHGDVSINDACRTSSPHSEEPQLSEYKSGTGSAFMVSDTLAEVQDVYSRKVDGGEINIKSELEYGAEPSAPVPENSCTEPEQEGPPDSERGGVTASAQQEGAFDHDFWDDKIKTALRRHYNIEEIFRFYTFQVPTTQEAIRDVLKPKYGYSGGTVIFGDGVSGDCTARSNQMTIEKGRREVTLTYSQVDGYIRDMIRRGELLSKKEIHALWNKMNKE